MNVCLLAAFSIQLNCVHTAIVASFSFFLLSSSSLLSINGTCLTLLLSLGYIVDASSFLRHLFSLSLFLILLSLVLFFLLPLSPVAPFCVQDQRTEYTVGLNEQTVITCEVQSDPSEATFKWFYNNSSETTELKNFLTSGSRSVLKYTPTSRYSYGTLFCVAQNSLGIQSKPCVFNVMPAGERIFFSPSLSFFSFF